LKAARTAVDTSILASVAGESALAIVERNQVPVMFMRCMDEQVATTRAWAELEEAVGSLRGRNFYGVFDPISHEYRASVELREGDDPRRLGLELGALDGGRRALCAGPTNRRAPGALRPNRADNAEIGTAAGL
jgi:hypothetical protein